MVGDCHIRDLVRDIGNGAITLNSGRSSGLPRGRINLDANSPSASQRFQGVTSSATQVQDAIAGSNECSKLSGFQLAADRSGLILPLKILGSLVTDIPVGVSVFKRRSIGRISQFAPLLFDSSALRLRFELKAEEVFKL
jgi:hypothetical protein